VRDQYDIYTAVPFLLIGLGMGTVLALLLAPRAGISAQELMARQRKAFTGTNGPSAQSKREVC